MHGLTEITPQLRTIIALHRMAYCVNCNFRANMHSHYSRMDEYRHFCAVDQPTGVCHSSCVQTAQWSLTHRKILVHSMHVCLQVIFCYALLYRAPAEWRSFHGQIKSGWVEPQSPHSPSSTLDTLVQKPKLSVSRFVRNFTINL